MTHIALFWWPNVVFGEGLTHICHQDIFSANGLTQNCHQDKCNPRDEVGRRWGLQFNIRFHDMLVTERPYTCQTVPNGCILPDRALARATHPLSQVPVKCRPSACQAIASGRALSHRLRTVWRGTSNLKKRPSLQCTILPAWIHFNPSMDM